MQPKRSFYNIARNTVLFFMALYLVSCKCKDRECKGLQSDFAQWIPADNVGDSIRFVNNNGARISFGVVQREIPVTHIADCYSSFGGCKCEACVYGTVAGYISYVTADTMRRTDTSGNVAQEFRIMSTNILQNDSNSVAIMRYSIFDLENTVSIDAGVKYFSDHKDSLLPSFTIGPRTYTNVIVHQADTTVNNPQIYYPPYNVFFIYKTWFNKEYGIVAFYDLVTQSLYYRE